MNDDNSNPPVQHITDTDALADLCTRLADEPFVAVDTEFMRDRTYYPKLCLVQIAGEHDVAIIDPLADGIDLAPLHALMADPHVTKVFHAARQDLEIFYRAMGTVPRPLLDSQLAAMVCGYGEEVGYETLVSRLARARIDKSSRFTDWSHRPLSEAQLHYAAGDVTHLRVIYKKLCKRLERTGRSAWVDEELATLLSPDTYDQPIDAAWKRLKVRSRDPRFLAIVRELAAWRETEAQRKDVPRNRIVRDDLIMEIAANKPVSVEALGRLKRVSVDKASAQAIIAAIQRALDLPDEHLPPIRVGTPPPKGIGPLMELLRVLLKLRCEDHDVAQRLVATTADLEALAQDDAADVAALHGWRYEVFGQAALDLKHGRLGLVVEDGQVCVRAVDSVASRADEA
ncbi:MAG: ribonuclease D [Geminicoccaceae bacterium]